MPHSETPPLNTFSLVKHMAFVRYVQNSLSVAGYLKRWLGRQQYWEKPRFVITLKQNQYTYILKKQHKRHFW